MAESDAFRGESILHRPRGRIRDPSSYLDIPCDQAYNLGSSQPGLECRRDGSASSFKPCAVALPYASS